MSRAVGNFELTAADQERSMLPTTTATPPVSNHKALEVIMTLMEAGFMLLVGVTPLLFTPLTSELFEFPKMVFIYALTWYELALWIILCLLQRKLVYVQTPLVWPVAAYLTTLILATIFSLDRYTSIAGYYTRFNGGLASILCYIALAYLLLILLKNHRHKENDSTLLDHPTDESEVSIIEAEPDPQAPPLLIHLLYTWLIGGTITACWGILEHLGHDPSCLLLRGTFGANCWVQDVQARVFATFGQPNWLAAYLVATIPLGITLLLLAKNRWIKGLLLLATASCYAGFWYTYSRAGWFGLLAALVILLAILPWKTWHTNRWWLLGLVSLCMAVSFSSTQLAAARTVSSLDSGGEDSSTGQIRLLVWDGTLQLIQHHPLLGTGPETFAYSFLPYRPQAMNNTTEWNFLYNKAHNDLLQSLATTGILGTLTWLSLFATAGYLLYRQGALPQRPWPRLKSQNVALNAPSKSLLDDPDRFVGVALFAGLVGVFVAQLLGFAVVMTSLLFWLSLAVMALPQTHLREKPLSTFWRYTATLMSTALLCTLALILYRYTAAEVLATRGSGELGTPQGQTDLQQAVALNPFEPTYHQNLALTDAYLALTTSNQQQYLEQQAVREADRAYHLNPHNILTAKGLIQVYQQLASLNARYNTDAVRVATAATQLSPTDADAWLRLADIQKDLGHKDQALASYRRLISLWPSGEAYAHLAQYYQKFGTPQDERAALQQAVQRDPNDTNSRQRLHELDQ